MAALPCARRSGPDAPPGPPSRRARGLPRRHPKRPLQHDFHFHRLDHHRRLSQFHASPGPTQESLTRPASGERNNASPVPARIRAPASFREAPHQAAACSHRIAGPGAIERNAHAADLEFAAADRRAQARFSLAIHRARGRAGLAACAAPLRTRFQPSGSAPHRQPYPANCTRAFGVKISAARRKSLSSGAAGKRGFAPSMKPVLALPANSGCTRHGETRDW